jgi:2-aminoadipate transaminase
MKSEFSALAQRTTEPPISWLMHLALERPTLISLAAGFTDNESLPVDAAREVMDEVLGAPKSGRPALQYGSTVGDLELRALTVKRLRELDQPTSGEAYAAERTLVTHGSQQLLYIVSECLCDPGDIVLVEDPTYFVFLGIAQSHGFNCRGVRMERDGIDLAHLEAVLERLKRQGELRRVKFLYLVSYFQNPSGITTSYAKKIAVLDILKCYERTAGHPIYLLEDAAYRELRFAGDDVPSGLRASKHAKRIIYAGTYSKPFATGARVGFGILPEPLFTYATRVKGNHDFGTTHLLQKLLAGALKSCRFAKHVGELQKRYATKARVMTNALRQHFPAEVEWEQPGGGLYVWAGLPAKLKSGRNSPLFKAALKDDVLYVPGELCYADDPSRTKPNHEMRLSFGGATEANIRTGIERLGAVIQGALRGRL